MALAENSITLCLVNGGWSLYSIWSPWSACSVSCGNGMTHRTRSRTCSNPIPKYGGRMCSGNTTDTSFAICNNIICPGISNDNYKRILEIIELKNQDSLECTLDSQTYGLEESVNLIYSKTNST